MRSKSFFLSIMACSLLAACSSYPTPKFINSVRKLDHDAVQPAVPAAVQELQSYKEACGGYYCNPRSKRAVELLRAAWVALGFVPADAEPGTIHRQLIDEYEELKAAYKKG